MKELRRIEKQRRKSLILKYMNNYMNEEFDDSVTLVKGDFLLPDGREIKYESWCEGGNTFLTYQVEARGLVLLDNEDIIQYMKEQGISISESLQEDILILKDEQWILISITCGVSDS